MLLEQTHVAAVGLEHEIEQIADNGDGADGEIGGNIAEHARQREFRGAALPGVMHDDERERARQHVADPRDEAEHGIPAEPNPGAGNAEIVIHHAGEPAHLRKPLLMAHAGAKVAEDRRPTGLHPPISPARPGSRLLFDLPLCCSRLAT